MDDLLIASKDIEKHLYHLRMVFRCLQNQVILVNLSKCELCILWLQFLGHEIDSQGICPLPDKVQTVKEFAQSTTVRS